jgi:hypothetical protein
MKTGDKLNYFGKECKVIDFDKTHVLIQFESGTKICTPKSTFEKI